ncbi:hypothetical protein CLNEO_29560 [Anaerotignum neopropionicum]|uniref:Uncharacterized protein n=1 Tax=Anaerotignum neopropionicum TaxID=36847 RepID=A0A136WAX4_9FIRM|nr:hypothetical protein [Anaerotignum neopropionicum]KXL51670.1 hypothetical protein CLNEO_29560 [Anaerotignum neopropionicum]
MTDKERKRRRMDMEKRMRERRGGRHITESSSRGLLIFRTYVTVILAGAFVLVSAFHTDTSEEVCRRLKETISYQIPGEEIATAKEKLMGFWEDRNISLPAFKDDESTQPEKVYKPDLEESP